MKHTNVKSIFKSTGFKVGVAVCAIIAAGVTAAVLLMPKNAIAVSTATKSATAENGSISTTVSGTGNLTASDTVNVTIPTGIEIDEVLVSSGDTVTSGQTLATVKKASVASSLTQVNESLSEINTTLNSGSLTDLQKEEYQALYADLTARKEVLTALHDSLAITATADGIIGSVNVSSAGTTSSASSSADTGSATTASYRNEDAQTSGDGFILLSASVPSADAAGISYVSTVSGESTDDTESSSSEESTDEPTPSPSEVQTVTDFSSLIIPSPVKGEYGITGLDAEKTSAQGYLVTSITWNCSGAFAADTEYTATIELKALDGYQFTSDYTPVLSNSVYSSSILGSGSGNRMIVTARYARTASEESRNDTSVTDEKSSAGGSITADAGSFGSGSLSSYFSGSDTSSGSSSGTVSSSSTSSSYTTGESTAFTIYTSDSYKISLNVDELDILSVKEGQTAKITLDAISDQEFEGTVTKVGTVGSTTGSSTKYTVEITIPKNDNMLLGMSASATITVSESDNAVLIPLDALQENGDKTYVYTSLDEDGNLSGETEVETGLSNASMVEITSGLSAGDTVYYIAAETDSSDMTIMSFGADAGAMGDGGNMGGGDMGGGPGGDEGHGGNAPGGPGGNSGQGGN